MTNTTWNPSDKSTGVTLTASNLNAKQSGKSSVRGVHSQSAGKLYVEFIMNPNGGNGNVGCGIALSTAVLNAWAYPGGSADTVTFSQVSGGVSVGTTGAATLGDAFNNTLVCMALDFDNHFIWFRKATGGNWNGSGTANPATPTGGITIPSGTYFPFAAFDTGVQSDILADFGDSAFSGTVPSGFTSGWPTVALTGGTGRRKRYLTIAT